MKIIFLYVAILLYGDLSVNGSLPGDLLPNDFDSSITTIDFLKEKAVEKLEARTNHIIDYLLIECKSYLNEYRVAKYTVAARLVYSEGITKLENVLQRYDLRSWNKSSSNVVASVNIALGLRYFELSLVLAEAGFPLPLDIRNAPRDRVDNFQQYVLKFVNAQYESIDRLPNKKYTLLADLQNRMRELVNGITDLEPVNLNTFQVKVNEKLETDFASIRRVSLFSTLYMIVLL